MAEQIQAALVLRKRATAALIGVSVATLDRMRAAGTFVRPIQLGEQAIGFMKADVENWLANRPYLAHFSESI